MAQARLVMEAAKRRRPDLDLELVTMKTSGDKILDRPLEAIGGKGLFTKELDEALRDGRVDICVHSYKDMPVPGDPSLPVVAVSGREDPRDVLILPEGRQDIPADLPIGTSSLRRRHQLSLLFPGRRCEPVRGNVQTRLRKLDNGEYGALVLAAAGLRRLGLWERAGRIFSTEEMIPAACQGILAIQGRAGEDHSYLRDINDGAAWSASLAERVFIEALGATCTSPVAAYAEAKDGELCLSGLYIDEGGRFHKGKKAGSESHAEEIGRDLARMLKSGGA